MKDIILKIVQSHQGIKATELVLKIMDKMGPCSFNQDEYHSAIAHLLRSGQIIELEYVLPTMDYRIKSIYFPEGTTLRENKIYETEKPNV